MVATDSLRDGAQEARWDFMATDFRITWAVNSLLIGAKSIKGDAAVAEEIAACGQRLRNPLKQVGDGV